MAQADGRIVIETSLESGGMKAGAKEIADACKNAAQTAAQMGGKAQVAIEKATNAISRQNAAYAQQLSKVDALRKKLNQMKSTPVKSEEYVKATNEVERLTEALAATRKERDGLLKSGADPDAYPAAGLSARVEMIKKELAQAKALKAELESKGTAYVPQDTTAVTSQLEQEEQKLAQMNAALGTSYALSNLVELISVDMPDNVIAISDRGFYHCPKLALTSLPSGITSIGEFAFGDCSNLALATLPSGITSVKRFTFSNCQKLALTSLPSGITSIGEFGFNNCTNLALTSLPSGITSLAKAVFQFCPKLALTALPSGVTSIGDYAFRGCTSLKLTIFPSGITSIGEHAFSDCTSLVSITLPPELTSIKNQAFLKCSGLETVKFTSTVSAIPNGVFSGCTKLSTIYVPWSQGEVANAPWGANNATIIYDYKEELP